MQEVRFQTVQVPAGQATSEAICMNAYETALYHVPSGMKSGNVLSFVGSTTDRGTFASVVDGNGNAMTATPAADSWQAFDSQLFGLGYVKLVSSAATAGALVITVCGSGPK